MSERGVDVEADLLIGLEVENARLLAYRHVRQCAEVRSVRAWERKDAASASALRELADLLLPNIQDAHARASDFDHELDERLEHRNRYLRVKRPKVVALLDDEKPGPRT